MFYSSTDNKWLTCTEHTVFGLSNTTSNILPKGTKMRRVSRGSHAGLISCMSRRTFSQQLRNKIIVQLLSLLHSFLFLLHHVQVLMILILSVSSCSFAWFNSWTIVCSLVLPCFSESSRSWTGIFDALGQLVNTDSVAEIISLPTPSLEVDCASLAWISSYRASKSTRRTSRHQDCTEHRFSANMYTTSRWQA